MTENVLTGETVIENLGKKAKDAAKVLRKLSAREKDAALEAMIEGLKNHVVEYVMSSGKVYFEKCAGVKMGRAWQRCGRNTCAGRTDGSYVAVSVGKCLMYGDRLAQ